MWAGCWFVAEFVLIVLSAAGGFGAVQATVVVPLGVAGLVFASLLRARSLLDATGVDERNNAYWMWVRGSVFGALVAIGLAYGFGVALRYAMF